MFDDKSISYKLAYLGIMTCLAIIFGYVEYLIPFNFGIPGMKLGLANVVTMYALYSLNYKYIYCILIIRIVLVGFLFGNVFAIIYSLAGGLLSLTLMIIIKRFKVFSMVGISILGGLFHNIGQLIIACFLVSEIRIAYYLPLLAIAGAITGLIIGITGKLIYDRVKFP